MPQDIISLLWHDHPEMTKEWYEHEKSRLPEDVLAREIDINYEKSSRSIVYKEFKDQHIFRGEFNLSPHLPVIRTLDYGKTCCCLFSQKDEFGNIFFFHEIVFIDQDDPTRTLAQAVQSYSANLSCSGFRDHDDPAGSHDNYVNSNEVSYKIVQMYGINPTHDVSVADNRRLQNRVELTKYKLSEFPGGVPVIQIHENMTYTINALQSGYRYKENKATREILDIILEEHPHEDVADCFGMTLMEEFTVSKNHGMTAKKAIRRPRNKYTGY